MFRAWCSISGWTDKELDILREKGKKKFKMLATPDMPSNVCFLKLTLFEYLKIMSCNKRRKNKLTVRKVNRYGRRVLNARYKIEKGQN